jgi:uncharacterized membrane protein
LAGVRTVADAAEVLAVLRPRAVAITLPKFVPASVAASAVSSAAAWAVAAALLLARVRALLRVCADRPSVF